jgi:hypothetical protein
MEAREVQRSASRKEGNNQTMEAARLPVEEQLPRIENGQLHAHPAVAAAASSKNRSAWMPSAPME